MKTAEQVRDELNEAFATVRAYRSSELYLAFIKLMDAIDEVHRDSLLNANPDRIQRIQGAANQVRQLRRSLVGTGQHDSPVG